MKAVINNTYKLFIYNKKQLFWGGSSLASCVVAVQHHKTDCPFGPMAIFLKQKRVWKVLHFVSFAELSLSSLHYQY